jgi:hypothetical protein
MQLNRGQVLKNIDTKSAIQVQRDIRDCQLELCSLVAHQHAAKLVPVDLSAIDDQQRQLAVIDVVPLDPVAHDPTVGDLQSVVAILGIPQLFKNTLAITG